MLIRKRKRWHWQNQPDLIKNRLITGLSTKGRGIGSHQKTCNSSSWMVIIHRMLLLSTWKDNSWAMALIDSVPDRSQCMYLCMYACVHHYRNSPIILSSVYPLSSLLFLSVIRKCYLYISCNFNLLLAQFSSQTSELIHQMMAFIIDM